MPPETLADDIRASIESLSDEAGKGPKGSSAGDGGAATGDEGTPAKKEGSEESLPAAGPSKEEGGEKPAAPASPGEEAKEGQEGAVEGAKPAAPGGQATPTASKAPASWTPVEREGWETLNPRHQQAVLRREQEMNTALQQTAAARRFAGEIAQVLEPYRHVLAQENATPAAAIKSLLETANVLRSSPAPTRAEAVADMILRFGVDINMLDEAIERRLKNGGGRDPMASVAQVIDQRLAPVLEFVRGQGAQRQQASQQELEQEWSSFSTNPEFEFAEDLRMEMGQLMEFAAQRGVQMGLQDAYKRAILLHPELVELQQRREAVKQAAQRSAAARRAQQASASLPSGSAPSQEQEEPDDGSVGSAVRASIRQLSRRQTS